MPRTLKRKYREKEAERFLKFRQQKQWTQREMAKEFNVSPGAIAHWEQGNRTIPGTVLRLLEMHEKK